MSSKNRGNPKSADGEDSPEPRRSTRSLPPRRGRGGNSTPSNENDSEVLEAQPATAESVSQLSSRTSPRTRPSRSRKASSNSSGAISSPASPQRSRSKKLSSPQAMNSIKGKKRDLPADSAAPPKLVASIDGNEITVKTVIGNVVFDSLSGDVIHGVPIGINLGGTNVGYLGQDGNLFHCQVCGEVGDVVCCDGCPRVYHQSCVPKGASRTSLDNDDDPWFCPECFQNADHMTTQDSHSPTPKKATANPESSGKGASRRGVKHKCCECGSTSTGVKIERCEGCGAFLHYPRCPNEDISNDSEMAGGRVMCSTCKSEVVGENLNEESQERDAPNNIGSAASKHERRSRKSSLDVEDNLNAEDQLNASDEISSPETKSMQDNSDIDGDEYDVDGDGDRVKSPSSGKRKRSASLASVSSRSVRSSPRKKKKDKKKKKKKKRFPEEEERSSAKDSFDDYVSYQERHPVTGIPQAFPGFFYFIGDNRYKIERSLSRKHRTFTRLPKGLERNELVAKEAAVMWFELKDADRRKYVEMSIADYEQRIIEWKEEKNLREMMIDTHAGEASDEENLDMTFDDEMLTYGKHKRLYLGTNVGSKAFKPESEETNNRVLLELLQDARFHPLPLVVPARTEDDYGEMDYSRVTIPHFDVHGPVSTSVGDECLGCARGWTHFCSVLKKRIPAVEHRAKLQAPLSSVVATRIGLGLRPRILPPYREEAEDDHQRRDCFSVHHKPVSVERRNLPLMPWEHLTYPQTRSDDIVEFLEEAFQMKVPEPPRPRNPANRTDVGKAALKRSGGLPTQDRQKSDSQDWTKRGYVIKCGRCRTIVQSDTGCVQCRRAQLVINRSKQASKDDAPEPPQCLKVNTLMLGRVKCSDAGGAPLSEGDQAIARAILRERWAPFAIQPPQTADAPIQKSHPKTDSDSCDDDESNSDRSSQLDEGVNSDSMEVDGSSDPSEGEHPEDGRSSGGHKLRSSRRITSAVNAASSVDESAHERLLGKHKKEAAELQRRTLHVACCGILHGLIRRDPLQLFASPVAAEGYAAIIKHPMDFGKIKANIFAKKYSSLGAFVADCKLVCTNALVYNPQGSIYAKTAYEILGLLGEMQKRASDWIAALREAHSSAFSRRPQCSGQPDAETGSDEESDGYDAFEQLRGKWPGAVDMLENSSWLRKALKTDFMRTKENEVAYYASLAIRRAATAAETSLAPYPDTGGTYNPVAKRTDVEDEHLRRMIAERVAVESETIQLKDVPTWREEAIMKVLKRSQSRRLEARIDSDTGCVRCDGVSIDPEIKVALNAHNIRWGRRVRKNEGVPRVDRSRAALSTGLASANAQKKISNFRKKMDSTASETEKAALLTDALVSVKGSRIHGWGLYADQAFKKGDIVAEYVGEYVCPAVTEAREKSYQEQRIQDYQFRVDHTVVIDATMKGGHARYINHNCTPNCKAKIIDGSPPHEHLKRVLIIADRDIKYAEEISYDYQFPLEMDLDARIPCNCQSNSCRGFMNWDLPEKGSRDRSIFRTQKRGANMRDRIRRLGRPLKGGKDEEEE